MNYLVIRVKTTEFIYLFKHYGYVSFNFSETMAHTGQRVKSPFPSTLVQVFVCVLR